MAAPSFPPGLPPLDPDAPELSPADRAYVAGLLPHQRAEAERTIRNLGAIFARNKLQPRGEHPPSLPQSARLSAGRPEGDSLPTNPADGMAEALEASRIHWRNRAEAAE